MCFQKMQTDKLRFPTPRTQEKTGLLRLRCLEPACFTGLLKATD
ncbi:hypothetical protein HMPREF3190_00019 [Umbribacter vaginalis]|nr:hypothetical protein HMPREF3190_00019 [Coriobacteriales bacterium DNF00809]